MGQSLANQANTTNSLLFTHLVVKVKPAEVSGFCRSSVSVRESTLSQKT